VSGFMPTTLECGRAPRLIWVANLSRLGLGCVLQAAPRLFIVGRRLGAGKLG